MRAFLLCPLLALTTWAQSVAFQVASVKLAVEPVRDTMFCIGPCTFGERMTVSAARVDIRYISLYNLVLTAYRVKPFQLTAPDWMKSQRFDIEAELPEGAAKTQVPEMLQALLAERFKLSLHRQTKDQPVYALVVGKGGSRLKPSAPDADAPVAETPGSSALYSPQGEGRSLADGSIALAGGPYGSLRGGRGPDGPMRWQFLNIRMPALAELLTPYLDRPVVDRTNLKGAYQFTSQNHPPESGAGRKGGGPPADPDALPAQSSNPFGEGLLAAIRKAGLRLESSKAPVEILVIDHLEKVPSAN